MQRFRQVDFASGLLPREEGSSEKGQVQHSESSDVEVSHVIILSWHCAAVYVRNTVKQFCQGFSCLPYPLPTLPIRVWLCVKSGTNRIRP